MPTLRSVPRRLALFGLLTVTAIVLAVSPSGVPTGDAASHRESPLLAFDPQADNTDVYFFVSPDRPDTVTIVANYVPIQGPGSGPEYYRFGDDVLYQLHIDNNGDAEEDVIYQFRFTTTVSNPNTVLYVTGPVTSIDDADIIVRQSYSVDMIRAGQRPMRILDGAPAVPAYVGTKSFPDYDAVAAQGIRALPGGGRVFVGPRDDPFFVNVGGAFDLLDVATNPKDELAGLNVSSIIVQLPITGLTRDGSRPTAATDAAAVLGVWATASRQAMRVMPPTGRPAPGRLPNTGDGTLDEAEESQRAGDDESMMDNAQAMDGPWVQVSRLGSPLVNELVIPRGMKDRFNGSHPRDDAQFLQYVLAPELATLLNAVLGFPAPTTNRTDLVQVFLTGVPGATMPPNVKPAEMLRLNVAVPPSANPNPLGVIGGDLGGYPNGRRPGDDVTDISLAAVGGVLQMVPGAAALTDNAQSNDKPYLASFPYVASPHPGHR